MALLIPPPHVLLGLEPSYLCALCGKPFFQGEQAAYERHVLDQTAHPLEEVREHSLTYSAPGLYDPNYEGRDQDWAKWIRDHKVSDPHGWDRWGKTGLDK